jgi:hypothetical protein
MINPSSKISLKMSCLASCKGDIDQATKLYGFLADGIESIPDFDIEPPTVFQQIKQGAGDVFSWFKSNKDEIMQGVSFIQSLRQGHGRPAELAQRSEALPNIPEP